MRYSNGHVGIARGVVAGLALLVAASVVAGGEVKKMPPDLTLAQSGDSPGKVTFSHATHVDAARPSCVTCHPRLFSILNVKSEERKITHKKMEKGAQCGSCHNGKTMFGFDDCTMCHK
jgi:c(7)-type cytochrome triheme protein